MVELPKGDVTEVRRGGPQSLQILSSDISRLVSNGYIRIERRPKEQMPRIGHVVFKNGIPMMALHEVSALIMGLEALLDIESDCAVIDSMLAVHELPSTDVDRILSLYPEAQFERSKDSSSDPDKHEWWSKTRFTSSTWRREERLPELQTIVEAPEALRQRSRAMLQRFEGLEKMLRPGDAFILDSTEPSHMFDLAGHLAVHGRPLLVLSRHDVEALNVQHNIPIASCSWLSQNNGSRTTEPSLGNIRRKIDAFLWENLRAVVVLEGIEYLASLHGDAHIVNFLRDIVDGVRLEDHLFLTTADFNAFSVTTRQHIERYMTPLEMPILEHWNLEPDLLLDHPLCAPASEEERQWIEQQLRESISKSPYGQTAGTDVLYEAMEGGLDAPDAVEIQSVTESLNTVAREWSDEEVEHPKQDRDIVAQQRSPEEHHDRFNEVEPTASRDSIPEVNESPVVHFDAEPASEEAPSASDFMPKVTAVAPQPGPRKAKKIRRKKKKMFERPNRSRQMTMFAAVRNAREPKDFNEVHTDEAHQPQAISKRLHEYSERQTKAAQKMSNVPSPRSSVYDATRQKVGRTEHVLPKTTMPNRPLAAVQDRMPVNTATSLTPLMARPGITVSAATGKPSREGAYRQQSKPSLEDKLTVWEIEDRQRLRDENEVKRE